MTSRLYAALVLVLVWAVPVSAQQATTTATTTLSDVAPKASTDAALAALKDELAALRKRVEQLESGSPPPPSSSVSPDGTTIPPATEIIDSDLARWTMGTDLILRCNGADSGGRATKMSWRTVSGTLRLSAFASHYDNNWWTWQRAGVCSGKWTMTGPTEPGTTPPPPPPSTTVTLAWDPGPETDTPPAAEFRVYVGTSPNVYDEVYATGLEQSFVYTATTAGTHYFAVTAVSADGVESDKSTPIEWTSGCI